MSQRNISSDVHPLFGCSNRNGSELDSEKKEEARKTSIEDTSNICDTSELLSPSFTINEDLSMALPLLKINHGPEEGCRQFELMERLSKYFYK